MPDAKTEELAAVFKALGDPTRLKLVAFLHDLKEPDSACVNALAGRLGVSQSAVSQHLRVLKNVGIVRGAIFVATPLLYPHWIFVVLGVPGIVILYLSTREEEKRLIERFGDDYHTYMKKVPRMNIIQGTIQILRQRKEE